MVALTFAALVFSSVLAASAATTSLADVPVSSAVASVAAGASAGAGASTSSALTSVAATTGAACAQSACRRWACFATHLRSRSGSSLSGHRLAFDLDLSGLGDDGGSDGRGGLGDDNLLGGHFGDSDTDENETVEDVKRQKEEGSATTQKPGGYVFEKGNGMCDSDDLAQARVTEPGERHGHYVRLL